MQHIVGVTKSQPTKKLDEEIGKNLTRDNGGGGEQYQREKKKESNREVEKKSYLQSFKLVRN